MNAQPPFALDGSVTKEKLEELLDVQTELAWLDYKEGCDPNQTKDLVEITKDIGAMMIEGGYLVIGVADSGEVTGISQHVAPLFDQATLASKVGRYLPERFDIRSSVHLIEVKGVDLRVAVVWVAPHPSGLCVFRADGNYPTGGGSTKSAFRQGNVYARHGTKSEPWSQGDIAVVIDGLIQSAKEAWRSELSAEILSMHREGEVQTTVMTAPSSALTWKLDAATFEDFIVELMRHNDDIPVRRMLRRASSDIRELVQQQASSDTRNDFSTALDRIATVGALGLEFDRSMYVDFAVDALVELADGTGGASLNPLPSQISASEIWLRIAERLYSLGSLAVRTRRWATVRRLATAKISSPFSEKNQPWHRLALTEASRAGLMHENSDAGQRLLSVLLFSRSVIVANPSLRPDVPGPLADEPDNTDVLLSSLCQFDFLAMVLAGVDVGAETTSQLSAVSYPNFSRFYGSRLGDLPRQLVLDPPTRSALVPGTPDSFLALILELVSQYAHAQGLRFWGWDGYSDPEVVSFIENNLQTA